MPRTLFPHYKDDDPRWCGFSDSLENLPLEAIRRDGYDVQEVTDQQGKYWKIIKAVDTPSDTP